MRGFSPGGLVADACADARQRLGCMVAAEEGNYVIGAAQRLGCVAATEVYAYVDSSLMLVNSSAAWLQLRCALSFLFRRSNLAARLDSTHTFVYAHGPFKRALEHADAVGMSFVTQKCC